MPNETPQKLSQEITLAEPQTSLNPSSFEQVKRIAELFQKSSLVPKALKGDTAGTMLVITQSIQLQIPWTVGVKELYVVDGKVNPSARLLRSLVERHPSCELFDVDEADEKSCTVVFKKTGWDAPKRLTYTLEDAKKAGLTSRNPNYASRPREMLIARASGLAAQTYFPSVCLGLDLDLGDEEPKTVHLGAATLKPENPFDAIVASTRPTPTPTTPEPEPEIEAEAEEIHEEPEIVAPGETSVPHEDPETQDGLEPDRIEAIRAYAEAELGLFGPTFLATWVKDRTAGTTQDLAALSVTEADKLMEAITGEARKQASFPRPKGKRNS